MGYSMKKAFRIIVPILLSLAILATAVWYLFVYDREFTRDILLSCARYFEDHGKHSTAQWFYDTAYAQVDDNDAIAIELSELYREDGNYTKAEYTLYKAIQDGGGIDLYLALSKLYVEQDKLLDAANLLNNVSGDIKTALEGMRPGMPQVSPAPGFYSQYITVEVTCDKGTLYVNPNGQYPSVKSDKYKEAVSLTQGENTIYAVSVSKEGLVSPLAVYGYTLGGIIEQIQFKDPAIEAQIRQTLNVASSTALYSNDLWKITEFTVPSEAKDYSDLAHMTSLEKLTIQEGVANQLGAISSMSALKELSVYSTAVSAEELQVIGSLTTLEKLTLTDCGISNISALEALEKLTYLDLGDNTIRDISALRSMTELQELSMHHNALGDLSDLVSCPKLSKLNLSYNSISTLAPLFSMNTVTWLDVSNNNLTGIQGISKLQNLECFKASSNQLTDISPVTGCKKLLELACASNQLTDISALGAMSQLMYLDFSRNQVTALPQFSKESELVTIDGSHNLLTSIAPLVGLPALNNVYMDYNTELASIVELADCPLLIRVDVYGTKVTEIKALLDMSVVVNYDPTNT